MALLEICGHVKIFIPQALKEARNVLEGEENEETD